MQIKNSRTVSGPWHPAIEHAANVTNYVWFAVTGRHPRVTGLGEEGHSVRSLHYGTPDDVRLRAIDIDADDTHLTPPQHQKIDIELRVRLGTAYDIIWEDMGTLNAHLHIEYQLKEVVLG